MGYWKFLFFFFDLRVLKRIGILTCSSIFQSPFEVWEGEREMKS
jgi:hypothetical protein